MKKIIKWKNFVFYIFSFLFSGMIILSQNMTKRKVFLESFVNNFKFNYSFFIKVFFLSIFVYCILKSILFFMRFLFLKRSKHVWAVKKVTIVTFICIFFSSLLFLLIYYPGSNMNDTLYILNDPVKYSFQYPLVYSLIIYFIYKTTWVFTSSMNFSFFMCGFVQIIFMSSVLTYVIRWFHKTFKRNYCTLLLVLYFSFTSIIVNLNSALLRDPIFSAFLLLLIPLFHKILVSRGRCFNDDIFLLKFVLIIGAVCLSRNNGIYVILLLILYLFLKYKKYFKKIVFVLVASLLLANLPDFFPKSLQREALFQESVAIPIQQLAFTIKYEGNLSEKDLDYVDSIIDIEEIKEVYNPFSVDDIKWNNKFNREDLNVTKNEFISIWLRNMPNNIEYYLKSYLLQTYELLSIQKYNPFQSEFLGINLEDEGIRRYFLKLSDQDLFSAKVQSYLEKYYEVTTLYFNNASCFWLMILFLLYCLDTRKYNCILLFLPLIGVWISLMIAAPIAFAFRYMCSFGYLLPFIIFYVLIQKSREY
ncbi:MAG: hypothetical protein IJV77_04430 [Clostridia bacterium]|nr:hypothetical protein [Clostridia bacterium]